MAAPRPGAKCAVCGATANELVDRAPYCYDHADRKWSEEYAGQFDADPRFEDPAERDDRDE